jgi:hypothetical protein
MIIQNCNKCRLRATFEKNPRSIVGRIWEWHIGWCPGWKSYIKSLPEDEREKVLDKSGNKYN